MTETTKFVRSKGIGLSPNERDLVARAIDTHIRELHRIRVVEERVLPFAIKQAFHDEIETASQLGTDIRDGEKG